MMKTQLTTLSVLTTLLLSGGVAYAETTAPDSTVYNIATRLNDYTCPVTFTPTKAIAVTGAPLRRSNQ